MEWTGTGVLDKDLINEIKSDYEGTHVLLYDSASDISIKFQPGSGLVYSILPGPPNQSSRQTVYQIGDHTLSAA